MEVSASVILVYADLGPRASDGVLVRLETEITVSATMPTWGLIAPTYMVVHFDDVACDAQC